MELSFRRLWSMRRLVFGVGAAELLVSATIIGTALHLMGQSWGGAAAWARSGLVSTALVLPLVGTTSPVGRSALAMLLFEDLAIVPIIFFLGALAPLCAAEGWSALLQTAVLA
jgi:CPA2 family monovalent cation:H+ antiporter-2